MSNYFDLNIKSTKDAPSELVSSYLNAEMQDISLSKWLYEFDDFKVSADIERAIRVFIKAVVNDQFLTRKAIRDDSALYNGVYTRYRAIYNNAAKWESYPKVTALEVWHGGYTDKLRTQRTAAMFAVKPVTALFNEAKNQIKEIYNLSDNDINKLHYYVEQVKAGASMPNSLRRMLYIWGETKMTGKTTSANWIVSTLNGYNDTSNIADMSSDLSTELSIGDKFKMPRISMHNCVLMDECFYSDMSKVYASFKKWLTSSDGHMRLPYGQEFVWHGQPNYVATSNEPLRKFIKDWGDRRYLSIEFASKPTKQLSIDEVGDLWRQFIINSERTQDWYSWAKDIEICAEEIGEMQEASAEYEVELQQSNFVDYLLNRQATSNLYDANNKITLKFFVDYFASISGSTIVNKRKSEIERAVINVYGKRYSSTNYWRLNELQDKARSIRDNNISEDNNDINLPF